VTQVDYYVTFYSMMILPAAVVVLLFAFFYVPTYLTAHCVRQVPFTGEQRRTRVWYQFVKLSLFALLVIYPRTSSTLLRFFVCQVCYFLHVIVLLSLCPKTIAFSNQSIEC
jgi:accessory gene regulator protein AgrB